MTGYRGPGQESQAGRPARAVGSWARLALLVAILGLALQPGAPSPRARAITAMAPGLPAARAGSLLPAAGALPPGRGAIYAALQSLTAPGAPLEGNRIRRVSFLPAAPLPGGSGAPPPPAGPARPELPPPAWLALIELAALPGRDGIDAVASALGRFPGLAGFALSAEGETASAPLWRSLPQPPAAAPPPAAAQGPPAGPGSGTPAAPIRIALTGDVSLGRRVATWTRLRGVHYPWEAVAPLLREADVAVINLESPLTDRGKPLRNKGIWLRGEPAFVAGLRWAGVDAAVVANNHSLDFGREGFVRSLQVLEQAGILPVGGGRDESEAAAPRVVEAGGWRLCLLAYTPFATLWWHPAERLPFLAGPGRPGVLPPDLERVRAALASCREAADAAIVSLHWGQEDVPRPSEEQRDLARRLVDAGADAVVGHHPHRLQGVEFYRGRPILYSLGNLVFDQRRDFQQRGAVAVLRWPEGTVELHPVRIVEGQPRPARGAEGRTILAELAALSSAWGTRVQLPSRDREAALALPARHGPARDGREDPPRGGRVP